MRGAEAHRGGTLSAGGVTRALILLVMLISFGPRSALGQFRCLDKSSCGISTDSQLKVCTSNLDCFCGKDEQERICTGPTCSLALSCGAGQVIRDYSCDGATWKSGGASASKDCALELKAPLTPLSQVIWCCGAPLPSSPTGGGAANGATGSGTGGATNSGTTSGSNTPAFFQWLAGNKKLQDFFKSEAAASAAFFAKFSPLVPPKADGPFLVYAHGRDVLSGSGVEVDLGAPTYLQPAPMVTITLKNNSTEAISLLDIRSSGGYGVIQQGFRKVSLSPGSTSLFQLKLDTASSGVKSAGYTILYKRGTRATESFRFTAGGIVWTSMQEAKDTAKKRRPCFVASKSSSSSSSSVAASSSQLPSGPPDPCARPTRTVNRNFPKMGSEELALAKAISDQQFESLIPKLTLSRAELLLKSALPANDIGARLFKLVVATNRLMASRGAVAALKGWAPSLLAARTTSLRGTTQGATASAIQQAISQEVLTTILPILQEAKGDLYGQARSQLILAIANVAELKVLVRLTTSVLLSRGVEELSNLNGMGRFFLRAALTRAYLSTNPPLEEADKVLAPVLKGVNDVASRAPLAKTIYSQYPELWVAEHIGGAP